MSLEKTRDAAEGNVRSAISATKCLPEQVFVGLWKFRMCEAEWLFGGVAVTELQCLLDVDNEDTACIVRLDPDELVKVPQTFCIRRSTAVAKYEAFLREPAGWRAFPFGRYGISSDSGSWAVYCEQLEDVAIVGVRHDLDATPYWRAMAGWQIRTVEEAVRGWRPPWRDAVLRNYTETV